VDHVVPHPVSQRWWTSPPNEALTTPSPNVSDGSEMETDEEDDLLAYTGEGRGGADSSGEDGFQHV